MTDNPYLSIIIPVFAAEETLGTTLDAVFASSGADFEVIIVLDGPDETCRMIAETYPVQILELTKQSGSAVARNKGAEKARGKFLLFIDADVAVEPDTLSKISAIVQSEGIDAIIGAYHPDCPHTGFFSRYKNLHHHYHHLASPPLTETFWTGCGVVRADLFKAMNGFTTDSFVRNISDINFGYRLTRAGYSISVQPQIQVRHHKRYTFQSLVQSDLFERAIPWTRIMWHNRVFKSSLNAGKSQFQSTLAVCLFPFFALLLFQSSLFLAGMLLCTAVFFYLNRKWFRFCAESSGLLFSIKAAAMEVVYYFICGIGAALGTIAHFRNQVT